jgi:hypothetical protein
MPGATPAARNKKGMKYAVTCANAWSYSAAASSLKVSSSVIPGSRFLSLSDGMFSNTRCRRQGRNHPARRYRCERRQWVVGQFADSLGFGSFLS